MRRPGGGRSGGALPETPEQKYRLICLSIVLDAATRKEIKRIKVGGPSAGILMSPDGSRAYVAVTPDNSLAVIDLKTLEVTGRILGIVGADGMTWAARE